MGYTTDFEGRFKFDKKLDDATYNLLQGLSETRRMKRDVSKLPDVPNELIGVFDWGVEGEFYFNPLTSDWGQEREDSVVDFNEPPASQPGLWLKWIPTLDKLHYEWDGGEKFYNYIEWLEYVIANILEPRGYKMNGEVKWFGEDRYDVGYITITDNKLTIRGDDR